MVKEDMLGGGVQSEGSPPQVYSTNQGAGIPGRDSRSREWAAV